jgi:hypothetical protein
MFFTFKITPILLLLGYTAVCTVGTLLHLLFSINSAGWLALMAAPIILIALFHQPLLYRLVASL